MKKKGVPEWMSSSLWSSSHLSSSLSFSASLSPSHSKAADQHSSPTPKADPPLTPTTPPTPPSPPISLKPPEPILVSQSPLPFPISPLNAPTEDPSDSARGNSFPSSVSPPEISHFSPRDPLNRSLLVAELSREIIDLHELRRLALQGIPDGAGIRPTVWKLLLGYLPNDRRQWGQELDRKRAQYQAFKAEFLVNPSEITRRLDESSSAKHAVVDFEGGLLHRSEITHGEHPLSLGQSSVWNQFFQDSEITEQIDRDVMRTHPDMHFFSGNSDFAKSNRESLRHILIVFAKLNPGIRYVQGMNEVLAPLFYVYQNDADANNADFAEPDAFFSFVQLLSGFRDNFCQKLDNSVFGIRSTLTKLSQLLKKHDWELWRYLEITTQVNPQFYAFRWITLLLTQEFNFADALHIWDTLLSDPEGPQETLLRICCAMLILVRRRLLAGDFTSNLKLLQKYPATNITHLLYVANKLCEK